MGIKPTRRFSPAAADPRTSLRSIHGSGLFADCPDLIGTPYAYAREEEVYGEGEEAGFVYRVVDGAVRSHKMLNDGRRQITGFHLAGDLFGFEQGETHWHTAEALSDTRVLIFPRRPIERAATRSAEVACQLWSMATASLRDAQDLALLLGRRSAQGRLAAFLIEVDRRFGGTGTFALPMTRRDIADYLGLTIETVSRTFSQLEEDGALRRTASRRITLHRGRLRPVAEA
ncbi:helix-turn-helix domain-containing protein [Methylorubrum thiocyanatum]|uniref:helix-turn-helix domain-containing protein n=1 Tax=Methylorubrum thiocyanatum TaxID=47958 RepID=UPI003666AD9A